MTITATTLREATDMALVVEYDRQAHAATKGSLTVRNMINAEWERRTNAA